MSAGQLGPSLLIQHPDEGLLVLVDDLHDPRMTLTEAEQQGLEQEWVGLCAYEAEPNSTAIAFKVVLL